MTINTRGGRLRAGFLARYPFDSGMGVPIEKHACSAPIGIIRARATSGDMCALRQSLDNPCSKHLIVSVSTHWSLLGRNRPVFQAVHSAQFQYVHSSAFWQQVKRTIKNQNPIYMRFFPKSIRIALYAERASYTLHQYPMEKGQVLACKCQVFQVEKRNFYGFLVSSLGEVSSFYLLRQFLVSQYKKLSKLLILQSF